MIYTTLIYTGNSVPVNDLIEFQKPFGAPAYITGVRFDDNLTYLTISTGSDRSMQRCIDSLSQRMELVKEDHPELAMGFVYLVK